MLKGRDVIGLPVICLENGENLGKVNDLFCSSNLEQVLSLQVAARNEKDLKQYAFNAVASMGRDAVLLKTAEPSEFVPHENCYSWQKIKGVRIFCNQGNELGTAVDMLFDFPEGRIVGLEVSEGFIGDLLSGRHLLSNELIQTCNENCIIVGF